MSTYHYYAGVTMGQADYKSAGHEHDSPTTALEAAIDWASDRWPDSDVTYAGVVWVVDAHGRMLSRDITIRPNTDDWRGGDR